MRAACNFANSKLNPFWYKNKGLRGKKEKDNTINNGCYVGSAAGQCTHSAWTKIGDITSLLTTILLKIAPSNNVTFLKNST